MLDKSSMISMMKNNGILVTSARRVRMMLKRGSSPSLLTTLVSTSSVRGTRMYIACVQYCRYDLADILPFVTDAVGAVVQDDFTSAFESSWHVRIMCCHC